MPCHSSKGFRYFLDGVIMAGLPAPQRPGMRLCRIPLCTKHPLVFTVRPCHRNMDYYMAGINLQPYINRHICQYFQEFFSSFMAPFPAKPVLSAAPSAIINRHILHGAARAHGPKADCPPPFLTFLPGEYGVNLFQTVSGIHAAPGGWCRRMASSIFDVR